MPEFVIRKRGPARDRDEVAINVQLFEEPGDEGTIVTLAVVDAAGGIADRGRIISFLPNGRMLRHRPDPGFGFQLNSCGRVLSDLG